MNLLNGLFFSLLTTLPLATSASANNSQVGSPTYLLGTTWCFEGANFWDNGGYLCPWLGITPPLPQVSFWKVYETSGACDQDQSTQVHNCFQVAHEDACETTYPGLGYGKTYCMDTNDGDFSMRVSCSVSECDNGIVE